MIWEVVTINCSATRDAFEVNFATVADAIDICDAAARPEIRYKNP